MMRFAFTAAAFVAVGYLWRSYWPVPVAFSPALSGSEVAEAEARESSLKTELSSLAEKFRTVELELAKLRQPAAPPHSTETRQAEEADRALRELLTAAQP